MNEKRFIWTNFTDHHCRMPGACTPVLPLLGPPGMAGAEQEDALSEGACPPGGLSSQAFQLPGTCLTCSVSPCGYQPCAGP